MSIADKDLTFSVNAKPPRESGIELLRIVAMFAIFTGNFEYWFVRDSDKVLALGVGVMAFLVFRNLRIGYHKWINTFASTTFGILLIHTNNAVMRQWLFVDFLQLPQHWNLPFVQFVLYNVVVWILLFCSLAAIDYLRIFMLERPVFKYFFQQGMPIVTGRYVWERRKPLIIC